MSGHKRRLLIVANTVSTFGGGERWALELAERLRDGYDVTIINPVSGHDVVRRSMADVRRQYGCRFVDIECRGMKSSAMGQNSFVLMVPKARALKRLADEVKGSDVVYALTMNPFLLIASVAAGRLHGKRLIFGLHNPLFPMLFEKSGVFQRTQKAVMRAVLSRIRYFHALKESDAALVRRHFGKAAVYTIPNFVDVKGRGARLPAAFNALFVGRLDTNQKGIDILYSVIERMGGKGSIRFTVVGAGGDGESLVQKAAREWPGTVKWKGFLSGEALEREYGRAAVLVMPSRFEGMPLAALEAQAHGLPVVCFDIDGMRGIVEDGKTGVKVKGLDPKRMADAIEGYAGRFYGDKKGYTRMMRDIAAATERKYGWKAIVPKLKRMLAGD